MKVYVQEYPVKRLTLPRWSCDVQKEICSKLQEKHTSLPTVKGRITFGKCTVTVTLGLLRSDRRTRVGPLYILPAIILREATSFRVSCGTQYLIYKEVTRGQAIILALYSSTGSVTCWHLIKAPSRVLYRRQVRYLREWE